MVKFFSIGHPNWVPLSTQDLQCHCRLCCLGATPAWSSLPTVYILHEVEILWQQNKSEEPAKLLEFLGILSDTLYRCSGVGQEVTLSQRDLESFLGHLCHAARVVCKGRPFFRICFLSFLMHARTPLKGMSTESLVVS